MLLLFALLVWPLVAFGGRSATTAAAHGASCLLCAVAVRRRMPAWPRELDAALWMVLAGVALQMLPLPEAVVGTISPAAGPLRASLSLDSSRTGGWLTLSLEPAATAWAWIVAAGAAAFFWSAGTLFRRGGVRRAARLVAALGFGVSLLAIAQAATAGRDIYWRYRTEFEGPLPFGPFVNRNHFATWTIMALPLCLGYVAARAGKRREAPPHVGTRARVVHSIDPRTAWLVAAAATMAVALLLSLSRSGALALGVAAGTTMLLSRRRLDPRRRRVLLVATAVVVVLALAWADLPALGRRLAGTPSGLAGRSAIWRETLPVVRDFPIAGTGAGTYQKAMQVYQRSDRTVYFNQAHNHYLQVAAEGGLLLAGAVGLVLAAFARLARQRIASDQSGMVWIRIGAACGLGAVALQSAWETGLVMPANAALAALLAAVVVHERAPGGR